MIDTIKVFTMIDQLTYKSIYNKSTIKKAYDNSNGQIFYEVVNNSIESLYNSSLSIRIGNGAKYKFFNKYYIEIEGSYHKFTKGYNSHNGYYNLQLIVYNLIKIVEKNYNIILPSLQHWFLQRVDIALCYDLFTQENVQTYIDNLKSCTFPKRKLKHYEGESIYLTGSTTTLKIYNKYKEFWKNDINKLKNTTFDIANFSQEILGFLRLECEIKKKKLISIYKKYYIRVISITYKELKDIWYSEFEKFYKSVQNDLIKVSKKDDVKKRLNSIYKSVRAKNLFNFYLLIKVQGLSEIKKDTNRSMYYKNLSDLRKAGIDFSQKMDNDFKTCDIDFNPFDSKEIL